jgi:hypothetical protein
VRIFLIPFASIIAALSLFSVSALAATTPDTTAASSSDASELPSACEIPAVAPLASTTSTATSTATATATATPITVSTTVTTSTAHDDADSDNDEDATGQTIRACVAALHDDGQHGIGQTVSEFAHAQNTERQADRLADDSHTGKDDSSPVGSATPTTTTTSTAIVTPATTTPTTGLEPTQHGRGHGGKHARD